METLLEDIPIESIPEYLGGKFALHNEAFAFDLSPTGPFYSKEEEENQSVGAKVRQNVDAATETQNEDGNKLDHVFSGVLSSSIEANADADADGDVESASVSPAYIPPPTSIFGMELEIEKFTD
jgi:hypothetical protein